MSNEFPISQASPETLEAAKNIRRGPKNSDRLRELDAKASAAIDRGDVKNERKAAIEFLLEYGNEGFDPDHINNRLRDIAARIRRYRAEKA